jgi:hypothetical protein
VFWNIATASNVDETKVTSLQRRENKKYEEEKAATFTK